MMNNTASASKRNSVSTSSTASSQSQSFRRRSKRSNRPAPLQWSSTSTTSSDYNYTDTDSLASASSLATSITSPFATSPTATSIGFGGVSHTNNSRSPTRATGSRPTSPCVSPRGKLAYLASRRSSRDSQGTTSTTTATADASPVHSPRASCKMRQRRQSNFLELPVFEPYNRPRVCSLPEGGFNLRDDIYRLRTFSITNKGIVNCGDALIPRRSRSNTSMASTNSRHSNLSGERSPFDGSCCGSSAVSSDEESEVEGAAGTSASCRESELDGIGGGDKVVKFRVVLLGHAGVGKSALVSQFMTSEYINTYDVSLDDEFGERTVSVLLEERESELVFIDHPTCEMSVENSLSTYEPHACIVVYSVTDKSSFQVVSDILRYLWQEGITQDKSVILVGNKCDLARARVISTQEGKSLASAHDCKFIETSSGIQHNVDELLVGVLKQCRLRHEATKQHKRRQRRKSKSKASSSPSSHKMTKNKFGSRTSLSLHLAKEILGKLCLHNSKSKSCENLHVL